MRFYMSELLKLPIGFFYGEAPIKELPLVETNGEVESIITKRPSQSSLYQWFGSILSATILKIGDTLVSSEYLAKSDKSDIPEAVKKIPLIDVGSLLIQVQRYCWEPVIKDQRIQCLQCGAKLTADIELEKLTIPEGDEQPIEFYTVKLSKTYEINTGVEALADYAGYKFNQVTFRVATLNDALRHEKIAKDEVLFWRNIAFDTLVSLSYVGPDGLEIAVPEGYLTKRGKLLFTRDLSTITLKEIRNGMQTQLPSVKFYYDDTCPECGEQTPFFANVNNFFSV